MELLDSVLRSFQWTCVAAVAYAVALFFVTGLVQFRRFDDVLRLCHAAHHALWMEMGSPIGYFWWPKRGASQFKGSLNRISAEWMITNSFAHRFRDDAEMLQKHGAYLRARRAPAKYGLLAVGCIASLIGLQVLRHGLA